MCGYTIIVFNHRLWGPASNIPIRSGYSWEYDGRRVQVESEGTLPPLPPPPLPPHPHTHPPQSLFQRPPSKIFSSGKPCFLLYSHRVTVIVSMVCVHYNANRYFLLRYLNWLNWSYSEWETIQSRIYQMVNHILKKACLQVFFCLFQTSRGLKNSKIFASHSIFSQAFHRGQCRNS